MEYVDDRQHRTSLTVVHIYCTREFLLILYGYKQQSIYLNTFEAKPGLFRKRLSRRSLVLNIYSASSPEELVKEFFDLVEQQSSYSYAVLPYIKGLTEPLKRLLKPHNIRMTTKPLYTLEQSFPSVFKTLHFS
jgi:hypothetical protein